MGFALQWQKPNEIFSLFAFRLLLLKGNAEEFNVRDKYTLSADGKTLTIDSHVRTPNGDLDMITVFEKQF
jgi:hypothetical protein